MFHDAISGGDFATPHPKTITTIENEFFTNLQSNLAATFTSVGVFNAEGKACPSVLPLISISFDGSTTDIGGLQSIALNAHWLDPGTCLPVHATLSLSRFQIKSKPGDTEESEAVRGTAANVATWVIEKLKDAGLVPKDHQSSIINKFIRAATTDNASVELCAVVKILGLPHQPCVCHSLELVVHAGVDPAHKKAHRDAHAAACAAAAAEGRDAPLPLSKFRLAIIVVLLAAAAKFCKKSRKGGSFKARQKSKGVLKPLSLISRAATRWSMSVRMLVRVIMLRSFWAYWATLGKPEWVFSPSDWVIMIQSTAFLLLFQRAVTSLQSRTLLLGAHLAVVHELISTINNPAASLLLLPADICPTADQLNTKGFSVMHSRFATVKINESTLCNDVKGLADRFKINLQHRLADPLLQLNSTASLWALFFDPALKGIAIDATMRGDTVLFSSSMKLAALNALKDKGVALERELAGQATEEEVEDEPPSKALLTARDRLFAAQQGAAAARRPAPRSDQAPSAFVSQWNQWLALPAQNVDASTFWASDLAKTAYPLVRRVFLSICSTRPASDENERCFSGLNLVAPTSRKGLLLPRTIERRIILKLNQHLWEPNPELKDDPQWLAIKAKYTKKVAKRAPADGGDGCGPSEPGPSGAAGADEAGGDSSDADTDTGEDEEEEEWNDDDSGDSD